MNMRHRYVPWHGTPAVAAASTQSGRAWPYARVRWLWALAMSVLIWMPIVATTASAAPTATLAVTAQLPDGKPLAGAVIQVYALEGAIRPSPPVQAIMDQVDLAFTPDLLVIPVGSTVSFPNTDTTSHQVYSFSPAHRFQLPLYRGKPYPPERFDRAGLVTLGCNIHDNMLAYILVTDATFFGRTDPSGSWSQAAVPRGRYRIELWHPRLREEPAHLNRELVVNESGPVDIVIRLEKPLRAAPLTNRPRSWNAY